MVFEDEEIVNDRVNIKQNRFKGIINLIKNAFDTRTVPYIIVLAILSNVTFLGVKPFGFVMLAVATIFNIPLMISLVTTLLMYVIFKTDMSVVINYAIVYLMYIIATPLIRIEGLSKKFATLIKIGSTVTIAMLISTILLKKGSALELVTMVLLVIGFLPVITSGFSMLMNIKKKIIFSKEETVSLAILVAFMLIPFSSIQVWGFNIVNVLLISLIVVIGWKNDWMVGTSTGVVLGLIYSLVTVYGQNTLIVSAFAFSGLVSGLLSRQNKWIVALAFVMGNFVLAYIYTRDITVWMRLAEVLVASGIILALPRRVIIKLEDLFGTVGGLKEGYNNLLGPAGSMKDRLNAMSEVLDNLSNITTPTDDRTLEETTNVVKKYLEDYKKNECLSCKNRINCLADNMDNVAEHIARRLEYNRPITKEMIPVDCDLADEIILNIQDIYSNMKLMRIVRQKENEASVKLAEEYKVVSNLIHDMAKEDVRAIKTETTQQKKIKEELRFMGYVVYEDLFEKTDDNITYEFITDILIDIEKAKKEIQKIVSDVIGTKMSIKLVLNSSKTEKSRIKLVPSSKYVVKAAVKQIRKADSPISGDSYIVTELKDNSKIIAISDGMGSGERSKEVSKSAVSMIEKMSAGGFNKNDIITILNRLIKLKESGEISATLDMCVINEKKDTMEFIKLGASSSFIIKEGIVEEIVQDNMPMGLLSDVQYSIVETKLERGMYVIMTSDGATCDVTKEVLQKTMDTIGNTLELTEKVLMDEIMKKVVGKQNKIVLDDITVVVCKIV